MMNLKHCFLQCNKSCGDDSYRHRQVRCQSHIGEIVADTSCSTLERPEGQMKCDLPQCYPTFTDMSKQYEWRGDVWSRVSKNLLQHFIAF